VDAVEGALVEEVDAVEEASVEDAEPETTEV